MSNLLKISTDGVFYSIQGEGMTMGFPAVFLRLFECNLKCDWCDTKYSWCEKNNNYQKWSVGDTAEKINFALGRDKNNNANHRLVITGGEPLLQKENIDNLMDILSDWAIEIETNGTLMPTARMLEKCQFNCSPKLANSLNKKSLRIKPDVINVLKDVNTYFKFVVEREKDIRELETDFIIPFGIDCRRVIIMPRGVSEKEIRENAIKIVEVVKNRGYRMLLRMHVALWGKKRKV